VALKLVESLDTAHACVKIRVLFRFMLLIID